MTKPNWIDVHFPLWGRPRKVAGAWICGGCGMANVLARASCSSCGCTKPGLAPSGGYTVSEPHLRSNDGSVWQCFTCGESGSGPLICRCTREARDCAPEEPT